MATYTVKQYDSSPPLQAYLHDENGPVPLAGATITFFMQQVDGVKAISGSAAAINAADPNANPNVQYAWRVDETDTDTPGVYRAEFEVVFAPGTAQVRRETFPSGEYLDIIIEPALGGR